VSLKARNFENLEFYLSKVYLKIKFFTAFKIFGREKKTMITVAPMLIKV